MMVASTMGATAFQKGLGAAHAMAHPVSAALDTHHGLAVSVFMPYVVAFNMKTIGEKVERLKRLLGLEQGIVDWLLARRGPYSGWILRGMGFTPSAAEVIDPRKGDPLPEPTRFGGVVVTGSAALVSDREAWSEQTARWIGGVLADDIPFLGICYGHQLLAHGQGGEVGVKEQPVSLRAAMRICPLLCSCTGAPCTPTSLTLAALHHRPRFAVSNQTSLCL
jgi:hypothetical protein